MAHSSMTAPKDYTEVMDKIAPRPRPLDLHNPYGERKQHNAKVKFGLGPGPQEAEHIDWHDKTMQKIDDEDNHLKVGDIWNTPYEQRVTPAPVPLAAANPTSASKKWHGMKHAGPLISKTARAGYAPAQPQGTEPVNPPGDVRDQRDIWPGPHKGTRAADPTAESAFKRKNILNTKLKKGS